MQFMIGIKFNLSLKKKMKCCYSNYFKFQNFSLSLMAIFDVYIHIFHKQNLLFSLFSHPRNPDVCTIWFRILVHSRRRWCGGHESDAEHVAPFEAPQHDLDRCPPSKRLLSKHRWVRIWVVCDSHSSSHEMQSFVDFFMEIQFFIEILFESVSRRLGSHWPSFHELTFFSFLRCWLFSLSISWQVFIDMWCWWLILNEKLRF